MRDSKKSAPEATLSPGGDAASAPQVPISRYRAMAAEAAISRRGTPGRWPESTLSQPLISAQLISPKELLGEFGDPQNECAIGTRKESAETCPQSPRILMKVIELYKIARPQSTPYNSAIIELPCSSRNAFQPPMDGNTREYEPTFASTGIVPAVSTVSLA